MLVPPAAFGISLGSVQILVWKWWLVLPIVYTSPLGGFHCQLKTTDWQQFIVIKISR